MTMGSIEPQYRTCKCEYWTSKIMSKKLNCPDFFPLKISKMKLMDERNFCGNYQYRWPKIRCFNLDSSSKKQPMVMTYCMTNFQRNSFLYSCIWYLIYYSFLFHGVNFHDSFFSKYWFISWLVIFSSLTKEFTL